MADVRITLAPLFYVAEFMYGNRIAKIMQL
jgi:hypothetical protein